MLIDLDRRIQAVSHAHMQTKRETRNKDTSIFNPAWFSKAQNRKKKKNIFFLFFMLDQTLLFNSMPQ